MQKQFTTYQLGTFIGFLKEHGCKRIGKEDLTKLEEIKVKFNPTGKIDNPTYIEYIDDCMKRFTK